MTDRLPQHSIEAEQAVIGGVLLVPEAFYRVATIVAESDFYRRDHQMIWRAIGELQGKGADPDAVTLGEWFEANEIDELVGGSRYILQLANTTPSAANIEAYAKIVAEKATFRRIQVAGQIIARIGADPGERDAIQATEEARAHLADTMPMDVRAVQTAKDAVKTAFARLQERYESNGLLSGLATGIPSLDSATNGLQPKKLYVLAARPSMGKSLIAGVVASAGAGTGKRVAIFSLEMAADEWADRMIASLARIDTELLASPKNLGDEHWPRITSAMSTISTWPLLIDESDTQTIASIQARVMQMQAGGALSLIILDHLGLMDIDDNKNTARQIGLVTKALKGLGKRLSVPVLLLCQLNRENAGREPTMGDLRESGRIEEDADAILMLHRPAYYQSGTPSTPLGYTKCFIRKLRGGKLRTLHWMVDLATMSVEDCEPWTEPNDDGDDRSSRNPARGFRKNRAPA